MVRLNERSKAVVMFPFLYYKLLVSNKRWHTGANMTATTHTADQTTITDEDFNALVGGAQGEDSIPELVDAAGILTDEQTRAAWHYVMGHIENRDEDGLPIPRWMGDASDLFDI